MRGDRRVDRLLDERRDLGGLLRGGGELDERADERHVIDLLERSLAPSELRRPPSEHQQRGAIVGGGRDRGHPVGDAGAGGQRAHADGARHLGPALGGERRGLLVADVDDLDPLGAAAVVDREQMTAGQREQLAHAVGAQPRGEQPPAVNLGARVRLRRHGRGRYSACAPSSAAPSIRMRSPSMKRRPSRSAGSAARCEREGPARSPTGGDRARGHAPPGGILPAGSLPPRRRLRGSRDLRGRTRRRTRAASLRARSWRRRRSPRRMTPPAARGGYWPETGRARRAEVARRARGRSASARVSSNRAQRAPPSSPTAGAGTHSTSPSTRSTRSATR